MRTTARLTGLAFTVCTIGALVGLVAACSGGSSIAALDDAGPSGSPDSGSTDSSADASNDPGASGFCTEFHVGGQSDPGIGGTAQSQVIAQSVADFAGAAATQVVELTAACKKLATALSAPANQQMAAEAQADPSEKMKAWCTVATMAVSSAKTSAGSIAITRSTSSCKLSVATKGACQARCSPSGTCDLAANPVKCTGGTLAGGFCEGGKLEGGCAVDAKCDASCDLTVIATATCPAPTVATSVTPSGSANATTLKSALDVALPTILSLQTHFDEEATVSSTAGGVADGLSDLKVSCIPKVITAADTAISQIAAGSSTGSSFIDSVH
ncbi:MAG: Tryptophan synthase alpha chain [Myxococcaceae bacterium]|jgi:septal ring-binding cell division protein DamX|nr:Tryptophan synthase alpha chain [Myxococcaceae bacterium]